MDGIVIKFVILSWVLYKLGMLCCELKVLRIDGIGVGRSCNSFMKLSVWILWVRLGFRFGFLLLERVELCL